MAYLFELYLRSQMLVMAVHTNVQQAISLVNQTQISILTSQVASFI